jgi:sterol desaturase/sphingolipid hydroxylase (fatty acid hydroxylase superfamily)
MVSLRNHPAELALEPFTRVWPLAFCVLSPVTFGLINLGNTLYQLLVHVDVRGSWGWFGRWILVSPAAHRIHHSPLAEHFNKNLAIFTIWDRLFGTWYGGSIINDKVGLGEPIHNNGNLLKELVEDVRAFCKAIFTAQKVPA